MHKLTALVVILLLALTMSSCSSNTIPPVPGDVVDPPSDDPIEVKPELGTAFMVMIDNHSKARPQHGLTSADVVYELICETGITRFLAGFHSKDPEFVGPIRSIRYYYLQIAKAYDLPLVHVGGNMDAMEMRTPLKIKSICDITNASGAFFLDSKRSRPFSTYITSESVLSVAAKRGYTPASLPELPQGDFPATQAATEAQLTYSKTYQVTWVYQEEEKQYSRLVNGQPHPTAEDADIVANNLIIIEAPVKTVQVPVDLVQSQIDIIGEGKALFLRDGKVMSGSWKKDKPGAHFTYTLEDGSELKYSAGNVWVQQVHSLTNDVVVK